MAIEALFKLQADTSQSDSALDRTSEKVQHIAAGAKSTLTVDASGALQDLSTLESKAQAIATGASAIKVTADTSSAIAGIEGVDAEAKKTFVSINELKDKLSALGAERGAATSKEAIALLNEEIKKTETELKQLEKTSKESLNPSPIDSFKEKFEGLGEKAKGALSGLGAGFLAGGLAVGLEKSLEAGKQELESQEKLKIALRQTGAEGDALNQKFNEAEAQAQQYAAAYARPVDSMRALQTEIAGLGGISGPAAKQVSEIGIAFDQLGIPAKALRGVIRGAVDPESAQALDALKSKFPQLGTALSGAGDSASKMAAVYKAVTPTLEGMKEAADGPLGQMQKLDESGKQLEKSAGVLLVSVLQPFIPVLTGIASVLQATLIPAFSALGTFVNENKTSLGILALGVGVLAVAMNAGAAGTLALTIAQKAQAISTGIVTGAQTALNLVMEANPIGLVIGAITLLAAGAVYLYNNVQPVRDVFDKVWLVLKGVGAFIGAFVKTEVAALAEGFGGVAKVIHGITTLDFSEVKAGVSDVGGAIGKHVTASAEGMKAFTSTVVEGAAKLKEEGDAGKEAGDKIKTASEAAAEAQKLIVAQAQAAVGAFDQQQKDLRDNVTYIEKQLASNDEKLRQAKEDQSNGKITLDQLQAISAEHDKANTLLRDSGKQRFSELQTMQKEQEAENKSIESQDKKKKAHSDLLALAKQNADEAAKQVEVDLRLARAKAGQLFTSQDELAVEKARTDEFSKQVDKFNLLAKGGKYEVKTNLEIDQEKIKTLEINAKIKLDRQKVLDDFNAATTDLTKKEIEVGIRPKSDGIKVIDDQIAQIQDKVNAIQASNIFGFDPKALAEQEKLQTQILGLTKERSDLEMQLDDQVAEARIKNIKNESEQALAERGRQFAKDLQFVRDAQNEGRELKAQELELKKQLEIRYAADVSKIRRDAALKDYNSELDLKRNLIEIAAKETISALEKERADAKSISDAERDDKRLGFDKELTDLKAKLAKGEISQRDYDVKLRLLDQNRNNFEVGLEKSKSGAILQTTKDVLGSIYDGYTKYFEGLFQKYVTDVVLNKTAEEQKTQDTIDGATARAQANGTAVDGNLKEASSSVLGAATTAISKALITLPFPINIGASIAAGFAITQAFQGLKSLLGFETGGIGLVGEKGPEIIGPTKDFSQMVTLLVSTTAASVKQAIMQQGGGYANGSQRVNVIVGGKAKLAGRDMDVTIKNEQLAQQNERLAKAA